MGKNKGKSLVKNYIFTLAYQLVSFFVPLITTPYLSKVFGPEGIGIYSFVNAVVAYFVIFAALGTSIYGAREIARTRDNKAENSRIFWEIVVFKTVTTIICVVVWIAYILLTSSYTRFYVVASAQIIATLFDISWFYEGHELFVSIAVRNTIVKILNVLYIFMMVKNSEDLSKYILSLGLFTLIGNLSLWLTLHRYIVKTCINAYGVFRHTKDTFAYFLPSVMILFYTVLDKVMLGILTQSRSENGYYEQAEKIVNIGKVIVTILPNVITTKMSYLFVKGSNVEILNKIRSSVDYCFLLGLPLVFGMMGISTVLVPWFLGPSFEKVIVLIYILCPLILIIGLSQTIGKVYLTPSGQRARCTKAIIGGAITNFILNLILIPRYASIGAAIASVFGEIVVTAGFFYMSKNHISIRDSIKDLWRKLIASIVMCFLIRSEVFYKMGISMKTTVAQILIGSVVYVVLLIIMRDRTLIEMKNRFTDGSKRT